MEEMYMLCMALLMPLPKCRPCQDWEQAEIASLLKEASRRHFGFLMG